MNNLGTSIKYILFISTIIFGCNQMDKKNNQEEASADISTETNASLQQSDSQNITGEPQAISTKSQSMTLKMRLYQQGIDFYARGNEPSWAVDIDMDIGIKFSHLDGTVFETNSVEIQKAADAMITRFSGGGDSGEIFVTVTEEECNDTMADETFHYSVVVEIKKEGMETAKLKGCGQYVPDYQLHDIWVLEEANGQKILNEMLNEKGSPVIEFHVEESRLSGFAGCNNMNGSFYRAGKNVLHFESFAMTRMMCPEMKLEDLIAKSVSGRRMKYEIKDLKLTLKGYDDTELIFKKID